jgi:hypothetical protein
VAAWLAGNCSTVACCPSLNLVTSTICPSGFKSVMMGITLILVDLAETGNLVSQPLETKAKHAFTPYLLLESELRARKEAYSHVALSMSKLLLGLLVLVLTAIADNGAQARADWLTQQDPQFGFTYSYQAGLFVPTEGERPSFSASDR